MLNRNLTNYSVNMWLFFIVVNITVSCSANDVKHGTVNKEQNQVTETVQQTTDSTMSQKSEQKLQVEMDTIFSKISMIQKVIELEKKVSNESDNQRHLSYIVRKEPTKDYHYYWIQVGVNNDIRFDPLLNFEVEEKTGKILFYDVDNEKKMPLSEWEKER